MAERGREGVCTRDSAPGHVYQERLGTGIEWQPGRARLYQGGAVIAEGTHATHTAWDFWYTLAFAQTFPQVEHWWFRSAWTGMVRISRPFQLRDARTIMGYIQFTDIETPAQLWTTTAEPLEMGIPFPIHNVEALNLPLRIALTRIVFGVINDDIDADTGDAPRPGGDVSDRAASAHDAPAADPPAHPPRARGSRASGCGPRCTRSVPVAARGGGAALAHSVVSVAGATHATGWKVRYRDSSRYVSLSVQFVALVVSEDTQTCD